MHLLAKCAMALAMAVPALAVHAAGYPDRPIRLIVGYAAGGGTDRLARLFAKSFSEQTGTSVVVEDRTGAVGTIAANLVSKSDPDGYTLLFSAGSDVTIVKYTMPSLPYDIYRSFTPIGRIAQTPYVLITNNKVPGTSVADLLAYIKSLPNPPAISAGASISRFTADLFSIRSKLPMQTVLYAGATTPMADLIGNQVQMGFDVLPSVLPQVKAGVIAARAVASAGRSPLLPGIPTMIESGFPDFISSVWYCLLAPPGTPAPIVDKLNEVLQKVVSSKTVQQQMLDQGYEAYPGDTPKQFGEFLQHETDRWGEVVQLTGFKP